MHTVLSLDSHRKDSGTRNNTSLDSGSVGCGRECQAVRIERSTVEPNESSSGIRIHRRNVYNAILLDRLGVFDATGDFVILPSCSSGGLQVSSSLIGL